MKKEIENTKLSESVKKLIDSSEFDKLKELISKNHSIDMAEALSNLDIKYIIVLLRVVETEDAAEIFSEFNPDIQIEIIKDINEKWVFDIFKELESDDAVDIIHELPSNMVKKILKNTSSETRSQINKLLKYDEDSAGGIMSVNFISLNHDLDVSSAINIIKTKHGELNEIDNNVFFVVDEKNKLIGSVSLSDLFFAKENKKISSLSNKNIVSVKTDEDQESVALKMQKYDLTSIPVINSQDALIGIITIDDVVDVISEEASEDIYKLAGVASDGSDNYFSTNIFKIIWSRLPSLIILLLMSTVGQFLVYYFLNKAGFVNNNKLDAIIWLFITPLIVVLSGTSGTVGNQLSALIVRGLSLNQIKLSDTIKILKRELITGFFIGCIIVLVNLIRSLCFYAAINHGQINKYIWTSILAVSVSVFINIMISNLLGCVMPLLAKAVKLDPAIVSGPLLTTIVDIVSIATLYGISFILINTML